ncbi:alpha/beta hydrolase [Brevundimonas sp.]|uniref:alpha/beta fold hydrolase n=1 Tax=Brevundimonas sp. TaxID=1871086 RepID=UPI001A355D81|nr:alpha/beta hydrolase [Brevundimonas sp.]MBJ7485113.1 alpha/beta hydrolase [Brevundimonas sp.]
MDAALLTPPRRMTIPVSHRWGTGEMSVLDFGDERRPVDLVFVHANGFNAATYRSLLAPLSASLRILAPDLRGHGLTALPTETRNRWNWHDHREDLVTLLDSLDGPPVALAGHSMGGTSSLLAAAERPDKVARLVMFDPVVMPRGLNLMMAIPGLRQWTRAWPITKGATRRRERFDNAQQALDSWRGRGAFKGWSEMMLADYVSGAFTPDEDGVRLACAPAWEASNYAAQGHDPWRALRRFDKPVRVLKAEKGSVCSLAPDPRRLPHLTVDTIAGGHLFPMTHPDIARDALFDAAV